VPVVTDMNVGLPITITSSVDTGRDDSEVVMLCTSQSGVLICWDSGPIAAILLRRRRSRNNWHIRKRRAKKVRREPKTAPRTAPRGSLVCEDVDRGNEELEGLLEVLDDDDDNDNDEGDNSKGTDECVESTLLSGVGIVEEKLAEAVVDLVRRCQEF
jgi:hypothetical protein